MCPPCRVVEQTPASPDAGVRVEFFLVADGPLLGEVELVQAQVIAGGQILVRVLGVLEQQALGARDRRADLRGDHALGALAADGRLLAQPGAQRRADGLLGAGAQRQAGAVAQDVAAALGGAGRELAVLGLAVVARRQAGDADQVDVALTDELGWLPPLAR
jgi:hypothetical protein